ncbi:uncharacterized protein GIQ15_05735 [Arthroderma uncinatum]|uniref:uncharacterized protein n=1 Tax=Arthroderma uncinatum TaxID=74035 RepID=UPI00144A60EB|nr:uncharacterized protein GIQ15_05735 [Arthroderma uncinatum]KAF3480388.1 hypothetical protein GIQ15_05735 [Arthroderma uncinatum]
MRPDTQTSSVEPNGTEDIWNDPKIVEDYRSAEKVTVVFARSLIEQSGILSIQREGKPLSILDHACGTGAVSAVLHEMLPDWKIDDGWKLTCADLSGAMIDAVKAKIDAEEWGNTDTAIADLHRTGLYTGHYTHVFVSFECLRILKPGGTLAFTTWEKCGWSDDVNAAIATMPGNLPKPTPKEFLMSLGNGDEWHNPDWVEAQLSKRGLKDIQVKLAPKTIATSTLTEILPSLAPIITHIPAKFWNSEQREQHGDNLASAVSSYLEKNYSVDQLIPMNWVAVVATAQKPAN